MWAGLRPLSTRLSLRTWIYWFTYELAQLLAALRVGGGLWSIQAVTLPPMEEE